jgi:RNA recognition motif-containing protein
MSHNYTGGKRQREMQRDRRKKEKQARLEHNRSMRRQGMGDPQIAAAPERLPEVRLEDVVISVAAQPRKNTIGPVKLFVGGMSWDTTTEGLRDAFSRFGKIVDVMVIVDRATGRSRGFGFVTFENAIDAGAAVKAMDGAELEGRTLKVNPAESR